MSTAGLPWDEPDADPMGDVVEFMRRAEEQYTRQLERNTMNHTCPRCWEVACRETLRTRAPIEDAYKRAVAEHSRALAAQADVRNAPKPKSVRGLRPSMVIIDEIKETP